MSNKETLNELFKKYKLNYDPSNPESKDNDVYKHKHYTIITRGGIQKIERATGITCDMEIITPISNPTSIVMKGIGHYEGRTYITYASASDLTSKNAYYAEMAEKRVRSRLILTLAGLYEQGAFGEDEADDFQASKPSQYSGYKKAEIRGE